MIDLRSDVCSVPTEAMWEAMRGADLGWALVGEDTSVNTLCERVADMLGKPAAVWLPTCGMGNLAAMLTFCAPGEKVVLEAASHVLSSESMGITEIARLEARPLWAADGRMDPRAVENLVTENHAALLVLENTHTRAGGTTLSAELTARLAIAAKRHDCRVHIDGARLLNASVALDVPLADLAAPANSVVVSLNKALSAPFGAVLAGSEEVVASVRVVAHRLGGGSVHRSGIAAAAALVALDTMVDRITDDHRHARELGAELAGIPGIRLQPEVIETNIVLADVSGTGLSSGELIPLLAAAGLRVFERDPTRIRFVTHRLVGDAETEEAAAIVAEVVERHAVPPLEEPEVEGLDEYLAWEAEQIQAIEQSERTERTE